MTFTECELVKKAGADSGWSIVESESKETIVLGSAAHDKRVSISCTEFEIDAEFDSEINADELSCVGPLDVCGKTIAIRNRDYDTLRLALKRMQELFVALPPAPIEIYNKRWKKLVEGGLDATETVESVKQRVGQDVYRETQEKYWKSACAVTGCAVPETLRASHAKPWADCESAEERLNVYNGFLLVANLDALFDKGLITFDDDGLLLVASSIPEKDRAALGLAPGLRLRWIDERHLPFLKYHREHVWRG